VMVSRIQPLPPPLLSWPSSKTGWAGPFEEGGTQSPTINTVSPRSMRTRAGHLHGVRPMADRVVQPERALLPPQHCQGVLRLSRKNGG